jgi:NAD(P)-dependent dehydrogenase (short-subunit alcohol dehydrogenase family)
MARIFITGSSDGLGALAAQRLIKNGHQVVLHARNAQRAKDATATCPGAETVLVGDLSRIQETKRLAEDANKLGTFDAVIHNAGLYTGGCRKTPEGFPALVVVNTFAPYILTCLMHKPKKLVYLSSGLHSGGDPSLKDAAWQERGEQGWNDGQAYANSKMHNIMFAKIIARRWKDVQATSMDPGWQPTRMGGRSAPGDLQAAVDTYVMLTEEHVKSGTYFKPGRVKAKPSRFCEDEKAQDQLLKLCEEYNGVTLPESSSL